MRYVNNYFLTLSIGLLSYFAVTSSHANWEDDLVFSNKKSIETSQNTMNSKDPLESYNRQIFSFNMAFHNSIGKPVTEAYLNYVPTPAQTGLNNFFSNLGMPLNIINSFLQGKGQQGLEGFMRFSLNSTFGLLGLLDIATPAGLELKKEDLGQTLYVWGLWDEASFVMLPILGPYTTRSLFGDIGDNSYDPVYDWVHEDINRNSIAITKGFISYAKATPLINELQSQPDPYIFMRESYLQYRTNLIYDGNPPQPALDDFNFN